MVGQTEIPANIFRGSTRVVKRSATESVQGEAGHSHSPTLREHRPSTKRGGAGSSVEFVDMPCTSMRIHAGELRQPSEQAGLARADQESHGAQRAGEDNAAKPKPD